MPNKFVFSSIIILISIAIIGAAVIYKFTSQNKAVREFAWSQIVQSQGIPENNLPTGLVYELEGTIEEISADKIRVSKDGKTKEFDTQFAQFPIISSFDSFEQWPLNVIEANKKSDFKAGDDIILVEKAVLNKTPVVGWVIKVKK